MPTARDAHPWDAHRPGHPPPGCLPPGCPPQCIRRCSKGVQETPWRRSSRRPQTAKDANAGGELPALGVVHAEPGMLQNHGEARASAPSNRAEARGPDKLEGEQRTWKTQRNGCRAHAGGGGVRHTAGCGAGEGAPRGRRSSSLTGLVATAGTPQARRLALRGGHTSIKIFSRYCRPGAQRIRSRLVDAVRWNQDCGVPRFAMRTSKGNSWVNSKGLS